MTINLNDLWASLEIMWKGMSGLFVVCIFVMLLVTLIYKIMELRSAIKGKNEQNG